MEKLSVKALSLAFGITWGLCMLFLGWAGALGWGAGLVTVLSSLYIGFDTTFGGAIIGLVWGFVDGAIGGAIFAWFYNMFMKK